MDPGRTARRSSPRLATALALTALWLALFAPQLLQGRVFVLGDSLVFRPFAELSRSRWLERHERTYWNPYVYAGLPASVSLADQRPQYLPDALLDLHERVRPGRWIPQGAPLAAVLAGMFAMAGLASALFRVGPAGMVVAGAAWCLMPNLLVPYAFGHDAQVVTCSLMPVVLLVIHGVVAAPDRMRAAGLGLALALLLAVQVLTGHPQIFVYSAMLATGFALERAWTLRRFGRLAWLGGAALLGAAMSAAVWWPTMLYSAHSFRGGFGSPGVTLPEVTRFSLAWRDLLSFGWPQAVGGREATYWGGMAGTDYPRYLGITVLAFGVAGLSRRSRAARGVSNLLVLASVAATLLALGTRLGWVYAAVNATVPFFSKFRVPSAGLIVAQWGMALAAARCFAPADPIADASGAAPGGAPAPAAVRPDRGAASAGRRRAGRGRRNRLAGPGGGTQANRPWWPGAALRSALPWTGLAALAAVALVGLGLVSGPLQGAYAALVVAARPDRSAAVALQAARMAGPDLLVRVVLLALALAVVRMLRRPRAGADASPAARVPWLGVAAVALVVLDLGSVTWPMLARANGPRAMLAARPINLLARAGARDHRARVSSTRLIVADSSTTVARRGGLEFYLNDWTYWRAHSLGGDHGALPDLWRLAKDLPRSYRAMCALGVVYMSGAPGPAWDPTLFAPVDRDSAEVVYRLRDAPGRAYAVDRVVAPGDDETLVRLMMSPLFEARRVALASDDAATGLYPGSAGCRIRWVEDEPDRIALDVEDSATAFVVVADTYFPGWRATVDGVAAPIHRVDQLVRGVVVPAGRHRLVMRYVPEGWAETLPVTRAAMGVWGLALAAWVVARSRRGRSVAAAPARGAR